MKRLVWLLILMVGTALARVSPVDLGHQREKACSCCEKSGECGNRDCGLPPCTSVAASLLAEQPPSSPSTTARQKMGRIYPLAIHRVFGPERQPQRQFSSVRHSTAVEQVPLFKAHCSFLI